MTEAGTGSFSKAGPSGPAASPWRDALILALLAAALALRVYIALETTYLYDEDRDWIPVALGISFDPASLRLPVREAVHPTLPSYFVRLGSLLFGENALGFRLFSLLAGTATIALAAAVANRWSGIRAARWTALLLAFNEYHAGVSALATEKAFYLLFCVGSIWAFQRFLSEERSRFLYLAGVSVGFAFLCKEIASLLIPVGLVALLLSTRREWLKRPAPYVAVLCFAAVIAPDLVWNLVNADTGVLQAGYADHLSRVSGIRLNYAPFTFYARTLVREALSAVGLPFYDHAPEYASMNWFFGLLLGVGVLSATRRELREREDFRRFLVLLFWAVFLFFTLVGTEAPAGKRMDSIVWFWVDVTLVPAVLVTARWLTTSNATSGVRRLRRYSEYGLLITAVVVAIGSAATSRWNLPSHTVGFCRGHLWPADGRMVELEARVSSCLLCQSDPDLVLESIRIENGETLPARPEVDVQGAEFGADDRAFRMRAANPSGGAFRTYAITYLRRGQTAMEPLPSVHLPVHPIPRRIPFWACDVSSTDRSSR